MLPKASKQIALATRLLALIGLISVQPISAASSEVAVVGAIESADCAASTVKILGVIFAANDAGTAAAICNAPSPLGLRYVAAIGVVKPDGRLTLTRLTSLSTGMYVPGASPVYLSGRISQARIGTGDAILAGAVVAFASTDFQVGIAVEVIGTQPVLGGVVLPTTARIIESGRAQAGQRIADSSIGSGKSLNSSIGSGISSNSSIGSGTSLNSSIGSGSEFQ